MGRPGWYVVQVETGRERITCEAIGRACRQADATSVSGSPLVREVFSPGYRARFKLHGEWHDEERLLLPGYVVAVTADPSRLASVLRNVSAFTRILRAEETFTPLSDDDRQWIERWTKEGDRTIPMSVAHKVGERVVVAEGPLKGHEAMITRIKRRLCQAELEIHAGQITIRATVGLAVLPDTTSDDNSAERQGIVPREDTTDTTA